MQELHYTGLKFPVLDHGFVNYVDHMGSDNAICRAARISYSRHGVEENPEKDRKLIARLFRDKHTSPFEMGKVVFNIKLPIFVMRQFVRHRMQNLNEVSARYTKLPDEFYVPESWRVQNKDNKQGSDVVGHFDPNVRDADGCYSSATIALSEICHKAYHLYEEMLSHGIAREMARMVLPVNVYTEIVCCWDVNNLLKFFALRDDAHAQAEIQEYARVMKEITKALFPFVMEAYENRVK